MQHFNNFTSHEATDQLPTQFAQTINDDVRDSAIFDHQHATSVKKNLNGLLASLQLDGENHN